MKHEHMSMTMNSEMQTCIQACQECHNECLMHASQHCLEVGGKHVEPKHFRLMLSCAEICQTSADMQSHAARWPAIPRADSANHQVLARCSCMLYATAPD
jgi:hypothetical protein